MGDKLNFQTDGGWWFVWFEDGSYDDAYLVSDDLSDVEYPRDSILNDLHERFPQCATWPIVIHPRAGGVK